VRILSGEVWRGFGRPTLAGEYPAKKHAIPVGREALRQAMMAGCGADAGGESSRCISGGNAQLPGRTGAVGYEHARLAGRPGRDDVSHPHDRRRDQRTDGAFRPARCHRGEYARAAALPGRARQAGGFLRSVGFAYCSSASPRIQSRCHLPIKSYFSGRSSTLEGVSISITDMASVLHDSTTIRCRFSESVRTQFNPGRHP